MTCELLNGNGSVELNGRKWHLCKEGSREVCKEGRKEGRELTMTRRSGDGGNDGM
ncbi:hypothetical protein SERLADRAFT_398801, partial [Serpula lacrymans var. lacrymans S7.9]